MARSKVAWVKNGWVKNGLGQKWPGQKWPGQKWLGSKMAIYRALHLFPRHTLFTYVLELTLSIYLFANITT